MSENIYPFPQANPRHRLAGLLLDIALSWITLGIGWFIWSLIVWGRGQTPGKQIVKLRVYDKKTGRPVRWGHMLIRQYLILAGIPIVLFILFYITGGIHFYSGNAGFLGFNFDPANIGNWYAGYGTAGGAFGFKSYAFIFLTLSYFFPIIDALWIFAGGKRNRLVDLIAKTDVLNESSARDTSNQYNHSSTHVQNPYTEDAAESDVTRKIREATTLFQSGHLSETEYLALKGRIIESD